MIDKNQNPEAYSPQVQDFQFFNVEKYKNGGVYKYAKIRFDNYTDLGCKIQNILETCKIALTNDNEKISVFDVAGALEVARQLIPFTELDLLDELHEQAIKDLNTI